MNAGDFALHVPSIGWRFREGAPCRIIEIAGAAATIEIPVRDSAGSLVRRLVPLSSLVYVPMSRHVDVQARFHIVEKQG